MNLGGAPVGSEKEAAADPATKVMFEVPEAAEPGLSVQFLGTAALCLTAAFKSFPTVRGLMGLNARKSISISDETAVMGTGLRHKEAVCGTKARKPDWRYNKGRGQKEPEQPEGLASLNQLRRPGQAEHYGTASSCPS
uniref:Uncharacterized protein n=1 Tax=Sphaerodactylus townsendi TaxID=933632 RepID=A0ACB8FLY6_9SAUR